MGRLDGSRILERWSGRRNGPRQEGRPAQMSRRERTTPGARLRAWVSDMVSDRMDFGGKEGKEGILASAWPHGFSLSVKGSLS